MYNVVIICVSPAMYNVAYIIIFVPFDRICAPTIQSLLII